MGGHGGGLFPTSPGKRQARLELQRQAVPEQHFPRGSSRPTRNRVKVKAARQAARRARARNRH